MNNKLVKNLLIIILLFTLTFISFECVENIQADSGWDTSYDSSWDSGSDWGGSSWDNDYDYDYDNDYDYSSGSRHSSSSCETTGCKVMAFVSVLIVLGMTFGIPVLIVVLSNKSLKMQSQRKIKELNLLFKEMEQEDVNHIIPNFNIQEFNFKSYQIFYDVQIAWMNFDYDNLKDLLTDELYNNYVMQLDALKIKNHRNIMNGFELIETSLSSLKEENDKYIAEVYLNVKFYDYVENDKTKIILRGTPNRKLNNIYKLTFIKSKEESKNINTCPMCGAPVEGNSTGTCEYCKSKLINSAHDWVMSKKEKISQR